MGHMQTSHHAVVFEGDTGAAREAALQYIEKVLEIPLRQNPDFSLVEYERVTIHEARKLKEEACNHPLGHARVFLIVCDTILLEAQNALLKLLEEPAERTHFVLILPTVETLLPTVRSRLFYAGRFFSTSKEGGDTTHFISASYKERMKIVARMTEDKDRVQARILISQLLTHVHNDGTERNAEALKDLALAADYIQDRSSSVKNILQHLAVTL
jgi:DNA polymerase III delta prime subunit